MTRIEAERQLTNLWATLVNDKQEWTRKIPEDQRIQYIKAIEVILPGPGPSARSVDHDAR